MSVEVGSTSLKLAEVLDLAEGSVVELDRQADELLDIMVNGTLIAKGEVVTVNGRYGIRIVEVATAEARMAEIGRAHVCTPVTNAHLVCRLLLEKKQQTRR